MNKNSYPKSFLFGIGGYLGDTYSVELKDGQLCTSAYGPHDTPKEPTNPFPKPTESEWQVFWKELDRIGVWDWKEHYTCSELIMDGTSWILEIDYNGKSLKTGGSNAFPSEFRRFEGAMQKLIIMEVQ